MGKKPGGAAEGPTTGFVFGGGIGALKVVAEPKGVEGCAGGWTFGVVGGAAAGTLSGPSLPGMAGGTVGTAGGDVGAAGAEGVAGAAGGTAMFVGEAGAGI